MERYFSVLVLEDDLACVDTLNSDQRHIMDVVFVDGPGAFDRSLKDLMENYLPFGGKNIVFSGDFKQLLLVVRNGIRAQVIDASFVKSTIWRHVSIFHLRENMRSGDDNAFATRLLSIGNGDEPTVSDHMKLLNHMVIPSTDDVSIEMLIDQVFPNLSQHVGEGNYMVERAITPLNEDAEKINA
ncbi:uncharacterized protein LOC125493796 [Beta vulgaris subsp. vulgaris]|uniref:uncharacterized protein LOC125493796 n=1 Tax=Beta vulgaris subsp. vulgaris TaxID=3555 RepID=UPI0020371C05|nr:uncharacterized protein LOC125493796 [Beta vulgaris subsp. vulgaris]